jgi:hypothetical protein
MPPSRQIEMPQIQIEMAQIMYGRSTDAPHVRTM